MWFSFLCLADISLLVIEFEVNNLWGLFFFGGVEFKSLSDAERLKMGKNARKYFENEFESEKQINKLIGLLGNWQ